MIPVKQPFFQVNKFNLIINQKNKIPSAIAPSTKIPDSLTSQLGSNRVSFSIGNKIGRISSRNTFDKTSSAAAEHFPLKIF